MISSHQVSQGGPEIEAVALAKGGTWVMGSLALPPPVRHCSLRDGSPSGVQGRSSDRGAPQKLKHICCFK
jgi:hypothetical protein